MVLGIMQCVFSKRCYQNVLIGFLEGGTPSRISAAKHIVEAGIALMENVGLTYQTLSVLDGFTPQTKNVPSGIKVQFDYPNQTYNKKLSIGDLYFLWNVPCRITLCLDQ